MTRRERPCAVGTEARSCLEFRAEKVILNPVGGLPPWLRRTDVWRRLTNPTRGAKLRAVTCVGVASGAQSHLAMLAASFTTHFDGLTPFNGALAEILKSVADIRRNAIGKRGPVSEGGVSQPWRGKSIYWHIITRPAKGFRPTRNIASRAEQSRPVFPLRVTRGALVPCRPFRGERNGGSNCSTHSEVQSCGRHLAIRFANCE